MKKTIHLLMPLLLFCVACTQEGYHISGTIEDSKVGDTLYLKAIENNEVITLGKTAPKNRHFSFEGKNNTPQLIYLLRINGKEINVVSEFFLEKGKINLQVNSKRSIVKGTPLNDALQEYKDSVDIMDAMLRDINEETSQPNLSKEDTKKNSTSMAVVSYVRLKMTKNALLKNSDTPVGVYILAGNFEFIDPQEGLEIISHFSSENQSNEKVAYIKEMFTHQLATEKGKPFTDIQLPTLQGDEAKLSDYAGKGFPVLLYYWSSESRASISNIPFMKSLWQRYSPQGLRIVAISLDTQKSLWKKTVETNELNWIQLSDLKGWNSPSLTLYGVSSFPYSVLIGQEGKILSKGEKGENLQKAIERSLIPSTKE